VYESQGKSDDACEAIGHALEACPDAGEALQRDGVCQARKGDTELAAKRFDACIDKASQVDMKETCRKLKEQLTQ